MPDGPLPAPVGVPASVITGVGVPVCLDVGWPRLAACCTGRARRARREAAIAVVLLARATLLTDAAAVAGAQTRASTAAVAALLGLAGFLIEDSTATATRKAEA